MGQISYGNLMQNMEEAPLVKQAPDHMQNFFNGQLGFGTVPPVWRTCE